MTTTTSGLQYEDTIEGTGDTAVAGQHVSVHYTGWLYNDGTKGALVLPLASSPTKPPAPKSVATLSMDKDQTVRLEGKPLAVADLGAELINLARTRPETGVLVQMHRDLPVQALVELMDKLRAAGISRTAVATSSKTE
jgi:biopolymer transport protein ExbD